MYSLILQTAFAVLTTSVSGLIIDVIQTVPGRNNLPLLRLCRPLTNQPPVAINPLKTTCPDGSSVFWLWNYNSQPSDNMQTLVNLLGVTSNSRETPYLLSQAEYNTMFSYGFTNPGLRLQPSVFKIKRGGAYQAIDSNNQLQVGDVLDYFGPVANPSDDKALRIQSQNKSPPYLMRQLTDASGKVIQDISYPTVTLSINSLGNTELVLPKGNWLQRGAQGITNAANALQSGFNNLVTNPLANTATYITKNSPQWRENAKTWIGQTGTNLYNKTGALINNGVNYIAQPLANAGGWVETQVVKGIDRAGNALNSAVDRTGNALNSAVDYIAAPLVAGGEWVETATNDYIAKPLGQAGAWVGDTAANTYNTVRQDLTGIGPAIGLGWQTVRDVANEGLANTGNWARGKINNGLRGVDRWVNGVPILQTVDGTGQVVQPVPSLISYPQGVVPSGVPLAGQVNDNSNVLPIVAPPSSSGDSAGVLGASNGVPAQMRTGGLVTNGNYPWGMTASQYYAPGQAKA